MRQKFYPAASSSTRLVVAGPQPTCGDFFTLRERDPSRRLVSPLSGPPRDHAGRATTTHHVGRVQPLRPPRGGHALGCFGGFARIPGRRPLPGTAKQRPLTLVARPVLVIVSLLS